MYGALLLPGHPVDGGLAAGGARVLAGVEKLSAQKHDSVVSSCRDEPHEEDHRRLLGHAGAEQILDGSSAARSALVQNQAPMHLWLAIQSGHLNKDEKFRLAISRVDLLKENIVIISSYLVELIFYGLLLPHDRQVHGTFRQPGGHHQKQYERKGGECDQVPPTQGRHDHPSNQGLETGPNGPEETQHEDGLPTSLGGQVLRVQRASLRKRREKNNADRYVVDFLLYNINCTWGTPPINIPTRNLRNRTHMKEGANAVMNPK